MDESLRVEPLVFIFLLDQPILWDRTTLYRGCQSLDFLLDELSLLQRPEQRRLSCRQQFTRQLDVEQRVADMDRLPLKGMNLDDDSMNRSRDSLLAMPRFFNDLSGNHRHAPVIGQHDGRHFQSKIFSRLIG